jgi:hypothetical protein
MVAILSKPVNSILKNAFIFVITDTTESAIKELFLLAGFARTGVLSSVSLFVM